MKITSIKENRDIETNELKGYVLNDSIHIPSLDCRYKKDIEKYLNNGGVITPAFTEDERLEYNKNKLLQETQTLADYWSKEIKNYVADKKLTSEQIERYNYKYEIALDCKANDNYDVFNAEADDLGISASNLVDLIIKNHDSWIVTIKENTLRIEYFRVALNKRINVITDLEEVALYEYKLKYAKDNYNINTTDDEIKQLLDLTEIPEE